MRSGQRRGNRLSFSRGLDCRDERGLTGRSSPTLTAGALPTEVRVIDHDPSGQAFARIALHHHAGIGLMTPDQVHHGQANRVDAAGQTTVDDDFRRNSERFVNRSPTRPTKPAAAWINPPIATSKAQT